MTQFSNGIYEDAQGNMVDINGKVLVEVEKRQGCVVLKGESMRSNDKLFAWPEEGQ